jgi:predicted permease
LPYPEPDRLLTIYESGRDFTRGSVAYPNFVDWRRESHSFTDIAVYRGDDVILTGAGQPQHLPGEYVSAAFFSVLGVSPRLGRGFLPQEDEKGAAGAVVLGYALWKRQFGADPKVLGKALALNGKSFTVVGVLPSTFRFRDQADVFLPLRLWTSVELDDRESHPGLHGLARLKPGVTVAAAQAEVSTLASQLSAQYPRTNAGRGVSLVVMKDDMVNNIRPTLLLLLGAVAFVLIIACANVANLLLARSTGRSREFAIRTALGAARARVIRQLLTESVLVALAGGALGVLLAYWGTGIALAALPDTLPRAEDIGIDGYVLLFTLGVSVLTGVLFGLAPAFKSARVSLQQSLKEGTRGAGGGRHRIEGAFVVLEMALAVILLVGAGLLIQSIWRLWRVNPGFNTGRLLTAQVALSPSVMSKPSTVRLAFDQVLSRVATVPGVRAVALNNLIPLSDNENDIGFWLGPGPQPPADQMRAALFYIASPDYLKVMGIPLLRGRFLTEQDTTASPNVVVIDDVMAKTVFPGENAVGKQISIMVLGPVQVVGVVGHVKHFGLDADDSAKIRNELYFPLKQIPDKFMTEAMVGVNLLMRTDGDPFRMLGAIRTQVAGPTLDQPMYGVRTMEQIITQSMAERRFTMLLLIIFASTALVLAAVGIYGVMSYAVGRRTHELGVRMALGASRQTVLTIVLRQGMTLALEGAILGLAGALMLTRFMAGLLFGVRPADPWTLIAVTLLLGGIALAACCVPALRAAKVDPMVALRYE